MNTLHTEIGEKKLFSREQNARGFRFKGRSWQAFWQFGVFRIIIATGICFLILTGIAMLFYPGGTMTDPHVHGYAFFSNFLSDLGRTSTPSGQDNLVSRLLFMLALIIGAFGIMLLFAAFTQFFTTPGTARWLSRLAAVCGLITGLCFIGVALVPLDRYGLLHNLFLYTASVDIHRCLSAAVSGRFAHARFPSQVCLCLRCFCFTYRRIIAGVHLDSLLWTSTRDTRLGDHPCYRAEDHCCCFNPHRAFGDTFCAAFASEL